MSLKAFDLVPVVDKINLGGDKVKSSIECLESWQENLYIGTTDCFIVHYAVEQGSSPTGKANFRTKLQRHKHLGLRKPIRQLLTCSAAGQLLVLCDANVYAVTMYGLEMKQGVTKELLRGITVMARNDRPRVFNPYEVQICVGTKRKTVQVLTVLEDKVLLLKEVSLPDPPMVLAIDGQTICTTIGHQYFLINYVTSAIQELFMYEAHNTLPLVKRIGKEEFLLSGPTNSMGMIVTAEGLSKHQPLTWSDGLRSVAFSYPYILALGVNTVTVHSVLDQRQKQAMSFQGGVLIGDFDGHVFVALQKAVMAFVVIPFDKQIQMLLIDKRVDEALDLSLVANHLDGKKYGANFLKQVRAQAGFVYFSQTKFKEAGDLLRESAVDPRELIVLYPSLMAADSSFTPSRPLLHSINDLNSVIKGSKHAYSEAKEFLLQYLEDSRHRYPDSATEIDTAIMKLYAECDHSRLSSFVSSPNSCSVPETITFLKHFLRHHALALFHVYHQQRRQAMEIWKQLIYNGITDQNFPGIDYVVKYLVDSKDYKLIWESVPWLLENNQKVAVKIFTQREDTENERSHFQPDTVIDFLVKFPDALQIYLENIVLVKKVDKEKFHTHLALIYVHKVLTIMKDPLIVAEELESARSKLQSLLETSSLYRVSAILQKIGEQPLHQEVAILYGKMDQHDKALQILVYKLKDYDEAERYCDVIAVGKSTIFKQKVFHTLLNTYLHPDEDGIRPEHLVLPAAKLLNTRSKEFDANYVLNSLPTDWSIDMITPFISTSLRHCIHENRIGQIEASISRADFLYTKAEYISYQNGALVLDDERSCDLCKKPFTEPTIARYPNGVVVHVHCARNKSVCPVTGMKFNS